MKNLNRCGMWRGNNQYVTILLPLVIMLITFTCGGATGSSRDNQLSPRSNGDSISAKLLHIRHLLASLFSDWNSGESDLKGPIARTFGLRMRKLIVPLAFMGGFLTAVIISIKFTGLLNLLLITKVLLLQLALVLGKLIYGAKELFEKKGHGYYPVYVPYGNSHGGSFGASIGGSFGGSHSASSPHSDWAKREDGIKLPYSGKWQPQSINIPPAYQPQFNEPTNYQFNYNQPRQSQSDFGQPQTGSFNGIAMQVPQSVQFSQPFNQVRTSSFTDPQQNFETLDNRIIHENSLESRAPEAQPLVATQQSPFSSLSPQEMTKLLTDAIAQMSERTTARSINRRSPFNFNYRNSRR